MIVLEVRGSCMAPYAFGTIDEVQITKCDGLVWACMTEQGSENTVALVCKQHVTVHAIRTSHSGAFTHTIRNVGTIINGKPVKEPKQHAMALKCNPLPVWVYIAESLASSSDFHGQRARAVGR